MNLARKKITAMQPTIGSWLSIESAMIPDILSGLGFDWLVVDLEHTTTSLGQASVLFDKILLNGMSPFVRIPCLDETIIKQCLDAGATGVIAPMVKTKADINRLIDACFYPPMGRRGVGLYKAQGFGDGFEKYRATHADEITVIAQIEHVEAVQNLEEILSVPRLDGIIIGPYDLSASIGQPGNFESKEFKDMISKIERLTMASGKSLGYHIVEPSAEVAAQKLAGGYNFLALGTDFLFMRRHAQAAMNKVLGTLDA